MDKLSTDGPDYVALVIEWEDAAQPFRVDSDITVPIASVRRVRNYSLPSFARTALGALGVLLVARWGLRRLRHA